jgi:methylphosphotriester-DNA--protein-cysteine methyltransferase
MGPQRLPAAFARQSRCNSQCALRPCRRAAPGALAELTSWLAAEGIVLVAADELQHETFQKDRQQTGLQPGQVRQLMPIALAVTNPAAGCYVRVHRRHGTHERRLEPQELQVGCRRGGCGRCSPWVLGSSPCVRAVGRGCWRSRWPR